MSRDNKTAYDLLFSARVMSTEIRSDQAPCKRKGKANKYLSGTSKRNLFAQKLVRIKTCPAPCKRGLTRAQTLVMTAKHDEWRNISVTVWNITNILIKLLFPPGDNFNRRVTGVCHLTSEIAP